VPALVECLKDRDRSVRAEAAMALGRIGEEPDLVTPALLEDLKEGDLMSRTWTALALGSFGDRAKSAVPAILNLIEQQKTNDSYRAELYQALQKIDPETFNKAAGH
jgi:HEAT repeat protein